MRCAGRAPPRQRPAEVRSVQHEILISSRSNRAPSGALFYPHLIERTAVANNCTLLYQTVRVFSAFNPVLPSRSRPSLPCWSYLPSRPQPNHQNEPSVHPGKSNTSTINPPLSPPAAVSQAGEPVSASRNNRSPSRPRLRQGEAAIADNASVLVTPAAMTRSIPRRLLRRRHPRAPRTSTSRAPPGSPPPEGPVTTDAGAHDIADGARVPNAYLILPE